jgi:hypothetical protein
MKGRAATIVIPAKAGIQLHFAASQSWTPACAGVTSDSGTARSSPAMTPSGRRAEKRGPDSP